MGDTVAHAARAPEDQEGGGGDKQCAHTPFCDTDIHNSVKQNGGVLSGNKSGPDAQHSACSMEGAAKGGGKDQDSMTAAAAEVKPAGGQPDMDNDQFGQEECCVTKDGSSENISSIEIDASVGNDRSFGTNTNTDDDILSPETESVPEFGAEESKQSALETTNLEGSLNDTPTKDCSTAVTDVMETSHQTSEEMSLSESGFVEGSTASDDTMQSAVAHPTSEGDNAAKDRRESSVSCGDKSVHSGIADLRILPAPSKTAMEEELRFLREEARQQSASVQRLQTSLYEQQVRANVAMVALRTQLRKKDTDMQRARGQHEQRMSALLSHLLYLEGQVRKEQRQVLELLHEKDDVIRRQKSAIEDLASKNARLLTALKEVHGYSGGNGLSAPTTPAEGGEKGAKAVLGTPVVLRNKDKGQKVRFGSVKDKLRRHKSSLELHRPASLDTLVEGALRYGSQENLSGSSKVASSPGSSRKGNEGLCSDELKKTRQQERKERCKSLIDYPFRLNDLPEVSSEVEKGRDESHLPDPLHDQSLSPSPRSSRSGQQLSSPHGRDSLYSDEEEAFFGAQSGMKQYGELAKSTSMPQSLAAPSDQELPPASVKERPHSLSGAELSLNMDKMTMLPMEKVSMCPSPTSQVPPGGSESNPFKSFKNVFRRRNSKQRSKKRPASLGQQTQQEYHEALKEHFKKYDLN